MRLCWRANSPCPIILDAGAASPASTSSFIVASAALKGAIAQARRSEEHIRSLCLMFDIVASDDEIMQLDTSLRQEEDQAVIALVCALARRRMIVAVGTGTGSIRRPKRF